MLPTCNDTRIQLQLRAALTELDAPTIEASVLSNAGLTLQSYTFPCVDLQITVELFL